MSKDVLLIGPLAHDTLCEALGVSGHKEAICGRLLGGSLAGIEADGWPQFQSGRECLEVRRVQVTSKLMRYAAVMGLKELPHEGEILLGVQAPHETGQKEWTEADWQPELAAAIARIILQEPDDIPPERIACRLPMIGVWAESRLRAENGPVSGGSLIETHDASDIQLQQREQPFAGFFSVEAWQLSHRKFDGSFTPEIRREGFIMGDAVVVLPWDPVRDRVLVIEQFRLGPAMRNDPQPWLLEAIAGRIDAGEAIEHAAIREAREETDLQLTQLFPALHCYPSPGAVTEFLYQFVGIADLPDGVSGVHGLEDEAEDIRGHVLARAELNRMVFDGQVTNGPLAMLVLWLQGRAEQLQDELAAG